MSTDHLLEEFPGSDEDSSIGNGSGHTTASGGEAEKSNWLKQAWDELVRAGLGETVFRVGTQVLSIALIVVAVWAMRSFYLYVQQSKVIAPHQEAAFAAELPTATPQIQASLPPYRVDYNISQGVGRLALLHTTIPTRPRTDIQIYVVEDGDTIFGIAEKFGLKPETILWGNTYTLGDDPHNLRVGQELVILPVDGTYHRWSAGEGLNGVAKGYGVTPEDIINWPGNHLDPTTLGDWTNPNIEPGTMLIVPGGKRAFVTWTTPRITRSNPGTAKILGPGFCGTIVDGAVGSGSFIWPSANHWLSGYDFSPSSNHYGIDIAGSTGDALYASDSGVIVYAGWNNYGYGYVIVVDHGNGWQTLYAHLSSINVGCGQSVYQGDLIGAIGSTGNSSGSHLHFEMMNDSYGKVNPWNFLPAP
jgi:hypothetical protein